MAAARTMNTLRGRLSMHEPLAHHTSWRVGGPADHFYAPADLEDLAQYLKQLPPDEPLYWMGLGSNLLVRDGGVRGSVIMLSGRLKALSLVNNHSVRAEAGVACAKLARFCIQHGLTGAEFLAGIPGTVGGALAMNAGAFGGETWPIVTAVETMDRHGAIRVRTPADFDIGYRSVQGPQGEWFVAGHFGLGADAAGSGKARIKSLLAQRGATQPTQLPNAGSVFRNPPGDYAARLIEASDLKGVCEGQACVSTLHANFIVNQGGATAAQIECLIEKIRTRVFQVHGVQLIPEVRVIGEVQ